MNQQNRSFTWPNQNFFPALPGTLGVLLAVMSVTGCGSSEPVATEMPVSVAPDVAGEKTKTVTAANESQAVSPAQSRVKLPDVDASPEKVCEMFMQHLNSGQRVKAERLLTSTALATTAKAGLYLQPIGGQDSKVTIKPAVYATNKQRLAQVQCIVEDVENGKQVSDDLTWVIRKSKSGWRILGFMLTGDNGVEDFLSFENVRDVDAILQMSVVSPPETADRQASNTLPLPSEKRVN